MKRPIEWARSAVARNESIRHNVRTLIATLAALGRPMRRQKPLGICCASSPISGSDPHAERCPFASPPLDIWIARLKSAGLPEWSERRPADRPQWRAKGELFVTSNNSNNSNNSDNSNNSNISNAGISGETGGGWFLPDRVDLPFVEEFDDPTPTPSDPTPAPVPIKEQLRKDAALKFQPRSWSARWYAWLVLMDFAETENGSTTGWKTSAAEVVNTVAATIDSATTADEIEGLVRAARDERAEALGEILSQDGEIITDFMGLLGMTPGSHTATYRVLHIAWLIGTYAVMHFKGQYHRPRPSQVCPALRPPIPVQDIRPSPAGTPRKLT